MEAVASAAARPDEELGARVRSEDLEAFAALYERHFLGIFDFALRVARNRDIAISVMRETFAHALTPEASHRPLDRYRMAAS